MAVGVRLETKLSTQLRITPEIRTALELLQLPQIELESRIEQEIQENPLLEWAEETASILEAQQEARQRERIEGTDFSLDRETPDYDPIERLTPDEPGLHAHLEWQVGIAPWDEPTKVVALELIPRIGPDGYLREPDAELAEALQIAAAEVAGARQALQTLEPTGVAARDACECLLLQLGERDDGDGLAAQILRRCAAELEDGDLGAIADALDVEPDEIAAALQDLRTLDPQPGARYRDDLSDPIQPEVTIERRDRGGYRVEPYSPYSRRVRRSEVMRRFQEDPESFSKQERSFLREKMRAAEYFLGSLKQRELTLVRVTEAIVRRQSRMLDEGEAAAGPLTLRDIADEVNLHESTISRVTRRKYAITPNGILELKAFFRQSVDGQHTPDMVKERIAALIAAEDTRKPLSDQTVADRLGREGVDIARRTVAKYRMELDIPTKSERRQRNT